jgi:drug/metabolite transporter (DMT)-like permease
MLCLFISLALMPISVATSVMQATGFVTAVFAFLFQGEQLSSLEITVILFGLLGCLMLTNADELNESSTTHERDLADKKEYPYYYVGLLFAVLFTVCSAMKFLAMSELGNMVHSSLKTFWFGIFSSVVTAIYVLFWDPSIFYLWKIGSPEYPMDSN